MLLSLHRPGGGGATVTSSSAPHIRLLSVFLTQTGVPDEPLTMIWTPVPTHCCTMLRHLTLVDGNSKGANRKQKQEEKVHRIKQLHGF